MDRDLIHPIFRALAIIGLILNITGAALCALAFGLTGDLRIALMAGVNLAFVIYLVYWFPWRA